MIKSIGQSVVAPIDTSKLRESGQTRAVNSPATSSTAESRAAAQSPAARMAEEGAPVDFDRIQQIKEAIASGNYPVDAHAIAEKMLALDLPTKN